MLLPFTLAPMCVDTVRLLNSGGMGILPIHCKNVTIRRYMLCHDEHSLGLIANAADAGIYAERS